MKYRYRNNRDKDYSLNTKVIIGINNQISFILLKTYLL